MIRFSLTRLQQQAPYELILSGDTEIMLYMCDTSDGREEIRNRLFLSWFEKHADKKRFVRLMQILKDKASFLLLSLRTATQSYMRLPLNSEKKPIY